MDGDDEEAQEVSTSASKEPKGAFRFWFDERRFKGKGKNCIVQRALFQSGGVRTGGHPKASPLPGPLGWQRATDWDFLWSPARLALKSVPTLKPGQLVCALPGLMSITKREAYSDQAWQLMPRSFMLPEELPAFKQWILTKPGAAEELWILKTAQHLGMGLTLLKGPAAVKEAGTKRKEGAKPYVLAQTYVPDPMLIDGRKFGIRVWVVVTGHNPLRAYLHCNGLVLFSTSRYDSETYATEAGEVALGHVTNYAQNMDGTVWDLHQLQQHMGDDAWKTLWDRIANNCAMVVSAALGPIKSEHELLKVPFGSTFELLGLDYLIDTQLQPWLLEANGTPSLAVDHSDPQVEDMIRTQKGGMVDDMIAMLDCKSRFGARYLALRLTAAAKTQAQAAEALAARAASRHTSSTSTTSNSSTSTTTAGSSSAAAAAAALPRLSRQLREQLLPSTDESVMGVVEEELRHRGGFAPLMPLFPYNGPFDHGYNLAWERRDLSLQRLLQQEMEVEGGEEGDEEAEAVAEQQQQQ
ncbi:MAG: hypothetical protein WDW38_006722 [Sanguina aurantia]